MASAPKASAGSSVQGLLRRENLPVVLTVAAMLVGIAALFPLVQSSQSTSRAGNIVQLEAEREALQTQLQELELSVASMGSLDHIEREAKRRFRMAPPEETIYIFADSPPPEARRIPSRYFAQEDTPDDESGASIWEDLFGWIPTPWD